MKSRPHRSARTERVWIGGYTAEMGGTARGVSAARVAPDGMVAEPRLAAPAPSPSFVAEHPFLPVLYAVAEDEGGLRAFAIAADGALTAIGEATDAGDGPCHVAIDPAGGFAAVACYGSGRVALCALDPVSGAITARTETGPGEDPDPAGSGGGCGRTSRAHYCQFLPDGRLLTTDLGLDLVRVWRRAGGELHLDHEVVFPRGAGPRHLAVGPDGRVYVVCEEAVAVYVLEAGDEGRYAITASSPLRASARDDGEYAAHISLSADATLLYATVRGPNVVAVLAVDADGAPAPLAEVPSGGNWPRHHAALGDRLYVANQFSDEVAVFRLGGDGVPAELVQRLRTGSPAVVVPSLRGPASD